MAAYVIPRFDNKPYILIEAGEYFGHVDIAITADIIEKDLAWQKRNFRKYMVRKFTVRALVNCEMLILTIEELQKMKMEFPEYYDEFFEGENQRLKQELLLKYNCFKVEESKLNKGIFSRLVGHFSPGLTPGGMSQSISFN